VGKITPPLALRADASHRVIGVHPWFHLSSSTELPRAAPLCGATGTPQFPCPCHPPPSPPDWRRRTATA